MDTDDVVFNASGYRYNSGTKTVEEFITLFKFDPRNYPRYFYVGKQFGYVSVNKEYWELCQRRADIVSRNWAVLGISNR